MEYQVDINKFAIIIIVGIFAIAGLFIGEQNLTSVCIGGLIGYLSKEYTGTDSENSENLNIEKVVPPHVNVPKSNTDENKDEQEETNNDTENINEDDEVA